MLERARALLEEAGATEVTRIDAERIDDGPPLSELLAPMLQSDSLFGGRPGAEVVDAQAMSSAEAERLAEIISTAPADGLLLVLVSAGSLPRPLTAVVTEHGRKVTVKRLRERDAAEWLSAELRRREDVDLDSEAVGALLQRFGSDVSGLAQALDQLAGGEGRVSRQEVLDRFRNRPDEPMWHYADAVAEGEVGEALRRLADFWTHGHPLQLLAFMENDLRRRALGAVAPDLETLAGWLGSSSSHFSVQKAWRRRNRTSDSELRAALDALSRADAHLKSAPEETHRLTMERLTVALCRWYGGPARRAG